MGNFGDVVPHIEGKHDLVVQQQKQQEILLEETTEIVPHLVIGEKFSSKAIETIHETMIRLSRQDKAIRKTLSFHLETGEIFDLVVYRPYRLRRMESSAGNVIVQIPARIDPPKEE